MVFYPFVVFQHKTKIIWVKQFPIVMKTNVGLDQEVVDRLNAIFMEEAAKYKDEQNLFVWDSHINFMNDWKSICLKPDIEFTAEEKREWRRDDWVHPGPIVMDHMADMLLNYICGR